LINLATIIEQHHRSNLLGASALFELAQEYPACIRLASEYVTQIILDRLLIPTSTVSPSPYVYELAQRLQILSRIKHEGDQQHYFLLLDIYAFVDYYLRNGQHERAFLVLRQLKLFPYSDEDEQARQLFASNRWVIYLSKNLIRISNRLLCLASTIIPTSMFSCTSYPFISHPIRNKFKFN
jgi:hypothetical protein